MQEKSTSNILDDIPNGLTDEQKKAIITRCNSPGSPPSIKELCEIVFGPGVDGRDKRSRVIKEFCGSIGKKFRVSYEYVKQSEEIKFTQEQEEFIKKHTSGPGPMTATEIARVLWSEPTIGNLDHRARAVKRYIESLPTYTYSDINEEIPDKGYEPPRTLVQAAYRVNLYVKDAISKEQLEKDTRVRKNLECLIRFCHNPRFLSLIETFESQLDRKLFESCFIRYLYSVGDELSEVDLDGYISLCLEVVNRTKLQSELDRLTKMRDDAMSQDQRLSMSIVEMIGKVHGAIDNTEKRQSQLRNALEGNRSKRLDQKLQANHSVLQLVDAWRNEEKRKRMLKWADERAKSVKSEVERLDNLDSIKVEIWGMDKEAF